MIKPTQKQIKAIIESTDGYLLSMDNSHDLYVGWMSKNFELSNKGKKNNNLAIDKCKINSINRFQIGYNTKDSSTFKARYLGILNLNYPGFLLNIFPDHRCSYPNYEGFAVFKQGKEYLIYKTEYTGVIENGK